MRIEQSPKRGGIEQCLPIGGGGSEPQQAGFQFKRLLIEKLHKSCQRAELASAETQGGFLILKTELLKPIAEQQDVGLNQFF